MQTQAIQNWGISTDLKKMVCKITVIGRESMLTNHVAKELSTLKEYCERQQIGIVFLEGETEILDLNQEPKLEVKIVKV